MVRALQAAFSRRSCHELGYCLACIPLGLTLSGLLPVLLLGPITLALLQPVRSLPWLVAAILLLQSAGMYLLLSRGTLRVAELHRRLVTRLLGEPIPARPQSLSGRVGHPVLGDLATRAGWRAAAYLLLRLPVGLLAGYPALLWVGGVADLSYPFWWGLFRNHDPGVQLDPVPFLTPFPGRLLWTVTFPGTFLAFGLGVLMLLAAPWATRALTGLDRFLARGLLGPDRLEQRVRDLEQTRASAVDDAAAQLRRVERDLHDGAQVRLAALAMNLGLAREKLGSGDEPHDLDRGRELLETAHRSAKEALVELRHLVRGIHPPVLDNGLPDALASLAADAGVPVHLDADVPVRPTPAIETIAYFCIAELLANAAKHSRARQVTVTVSGTGERLRLQVGDDGVGGAEVGRGSGLSGLTSRLRTVDGALAVDSPPGGPTLVTVDLPLRA